MEDSNPTPPEQSPSPAPEPALPASPPAELPPVETAAPEPAVETPPPPVQAPSPEPVVSAPVLAPATQTPPPARPAGDFRVRAAAARAAKKEARLQKLLEFVRRKGSASNDDIQKAIIVSDATATRYAFELIKKGLLKKSGKTKSIRYSPVG